MKDGSSNHERKASEEHHTACKRKTYADLLELDVLPAVSAEEAASFEYPRANQLQVGDVVSVEFGDRMWYAGALMSHIAEHRFYAVFIDGNEGI